MVNDEIAEAMRSALSPKWWTREFDWPQPQEATRWQASSETLRISSCPCKEAKKLDAIGRVFELRLGLMLQRGRAGSILGKNGTDADAVDASGDGRRGGQSGRKQSDNE